MEYFIEQAKIVLPVLGVNLFRHRLRLILSRSRDRVASAHVAVQDASPVFELTPEERAAFVATAQEVDGEFTVLRGSAGAVRTGSGVDDGHSRTGLRAKLEQDGTLVSSRQTARPCGSPRSHVFASPSAAAAVVLGRSCERTQ
ncbi:MAG: hypothetical protein V9F04_11100 [Dermatophilaceae bacterium]